MRFEYRKYENSSIATAVSNFLCGPLWFPIAFTLFLGLEGAVFFWALPVMETREAFVRGGISITEIYQFVMAVLCSIPSLAILVTKIMNVNHHFSDRIAGWDINGRKEARGLYFIIVWILLAIIGFGFIFYIQTSNQAIQEEYQRVISSANIGENIREDAWKIVLYDVENEQFLYSDEEIAA